MHGLVIFQFLVLLLSALLYVLLDRAILTKETLQASLWLVLWGMTVEGGCLMDLTACVPKVK
jgi:hypothetical protein